MCTFGDNNVIYTYVYDINIYIALMKDLCCNIMNNTKYHVYRNIYHQYPTNILNPISKLDNFAEETNQQTNFCRFDKNFKVKK